MRPLSIVSVVLYLAGSAQGVAAPLSADAPRPGVAQAAVIEPIAAPLVTQRSGASGRAGEVKLTALAENTSPAGLVTEDIPDSNDDYGSLSEYSRELFTALGALSSDESNRMRSRDRDSRRHAPGSGQSSPGPATETGPGPDLARQVLSRFIASRDSGGEIDLLAQYSAGKNSVNLTAGEMTSFEYYAGTASGGQRQSISLTGGGSSTGGSFLHRLFCILGFLSPEAVGLDQDCDYLPN